MFFAIFDREIPTYGLFVFYLMNTSVTLFKHFPDTNLEIISISASTQDEDSGAATGHNFVVARLGDLAFGK